MRNLTRTLILATALGLSLAVAGCGDSDSDTPSPANGIEAVTRQVLQDGEPATAAGQTLELTRVIIPAGEEIAAHTHPGIQLAVIVEGTLEYTVIDGEVEVRHEAGTAGATSETVASGNMVKLRPGSAVMEVPGMVHAARNAGSEAVVIYLSSLFPSGVPASSPVP